MASDPGVIDEMLSKAKNIAVVGMSDKPSRASHHIGKYLAEHGYTVFPVNPVLQSILGKPCYADLDAAQAAAKEKTGAGIDLVDVFREDVPVPSLSREEALANAPKTDGRGFLVPRILEGH